MTTCIKDVKVLKHIVAFSQENEKSKAEVKEYFDDKDDANEFYKELKFCENITHVRCYEEWV